MFNQQAKIGNQSIHFTNGSHNNCKCSSCTCRNAKANPQKFGWCQQHVVPLGITHFVSSSRKTTESTTKQCALQCVSNTSPFMIWSDMTFFWVPLMFPSWKNTTLLNLWMFDTAICLMESAMLLFMLHLFHFPSNAKHSLHWVVTLTLLQHCAVI